VGRRGILTVQDRWKFRQQPAQQESFADARGAMNEEGTLLRQALPDALCFFFPIEDEFRHHVISGRSQHNAVAAALWHCAT
jgi:hypothetical protein